MLTAPTVVEGIVVSDYRSPNMELNPNLNYFSVDLEENDRTAYVEAADGSCGIRLRFDEASETRLARYDRVRLDLDGCRLTRTASPDCMTLTGVQALNVLSVAPGTAADLPLKERTVATLTDDDLYTFVTLRDAEFVFKEGSYTNIWEPYAQSCGELHHYKYDINNRMDGWASLVRDAEGGTIYMLVNTLCAWRRAGKPLPQGMGPLSGVVVHTPMRRYGGDMGRYSIRPLDEGRHRRRPQAQLPVETPHGVAARRFGGRVARIRTARLPEPRNRGPEGRPGAQRRRKFARLSLDRLRRFRARRRRLQRPRDAEQGMGRQRRGGLQGPDARLVQLGQHGAHGRLKRLLHRFSDQKARGTALQLAFEWGAGNQDGNFSWNFPLEWKAEYAVDGGEFQPLRDAATGRGTFVLRSLPWWDKVIDGSGHTDRLRTPYDCGMGLQQRVFRLPAEALGRDEVVVRLARLGSVVADSRQPPPPT